MRINKHREAILAAVCTMRTHPTAEEIYGKLKKDIPRLSLGTVYRNLNAFAVNGDIRRVCVPGESDRFDFRLDRHEHLLCGKCRRVFDIGAEIDVKLGKNDAEVDGYTLILHGTCANCIQNPEGIASN